MDSEVRARLSMDKWLCGFACIERSEPLEEEKHPLNLELWVCDHRRADGNLKHP